LKTSTEIRQDFLDFFLSKGHKIVPSAPVIPYDDPTLLFANAGMNQFKDVFLGTGRRDYSRCADTQKCIRVSGKHNDLEEVGHDGYHHTFFEMLGNWSFGDYYKKEAITWAWELFTKIWKLPKERLWATVFETDDDAYNLWKSETDIDPSHVLRFDEKENFWEMGDTGPCGPCSEIHIDLTKNGCKNEDVNSGSDEVIELWNLVFIQYDRDENGILHDLPQKHVDTGMGFERIVRVLQKKNSNYETDVFLPLINELIELSGKDYSAPPILLTRLRNGQEGEGNKSSIVSSMNVIADHVRALTFAIADGAIPSNEGRGYVLRRILRRAARYGRNLGMHKPFIYNLVDVLVRTMSNVFPEIKEKKEFIKEVIQSEEESFNETLDRGLVYFNEEIEKMEKHAGVYHDKPAVFSGEVAFKLHDTYGFPIDLTQLMAREKGLSVDNDKFEMLMNEQKERARKARDESSIKTEIKFDSEKKVNYDPYNLIPEGVKTKLELSKSENGHKLIVLKQNPFYSESGGQVSDTGKLIIPGVDIEVNVIDSKKDYVVIDSPEFKIPEGVEVIAKVNFERRQSVQRNHSATHLVHEALRRVLGPHVKQMGSYLDDKLLRFDFPHFHKLKPEEVAAIEDIVNDKIKENIQVNWEFMPIERADKIPNVKKFFGEKYGEEVRVVFIDEGFSVEFCGGTHVPETLDIGLFKIVKEESVSSGTRRIFARTGEGIIRLIDEKIEDIEHVLADLPEKYRTNFKSAINELNISNEDIDFRDSETLKKLIEYQDLTYNSLLDLREKYFEEKKLEEKKLAKQKIEKESEKLESLVSSAPRIEGVKVVTTVSDVDSMEELKSLGDRLRQIDVNVVGATAAIIDGKVNIVAVVSDNLIKQKGLDAGKIAKDIAKIVGGGGGGKPHLATAGGKDVSRLNEAMSQVKNIVQNYLNKSK
jgi:alanyl-tRNA synthetase